MKKILLLLLPVIAFAFTMMPEKANFSGEWSLNENKSELGEFGGRFAARKIKVEQKEGSISISKTAPSFNGDEQTTTETFTFDGKETESTVFGGAKKKSVLKWAADEQSFTVTYSIAFERDGQTFDIKGSDVWSLSDGGKTLSSVITSSSPQGEMVMKGIYEKK